MNQEIDKIVVSKDAFDNVKEMLGHHIKDNCDFCGDNITKYNFGICHKDKTCCNSFLCITEYIEWEKENK